MPQPKVRLNSAQKSKSRPIVSNLKPGTYQLHEWEWQEDVVGNNGEYQVVRLKGTIKQGETIVGNREIILPFDIGEQYLEPADNASIIEFKVEMQADKLGVLRPRTEFQAIIEAEIEEEEEEEEVKPKKGKTGK